MFSSASTDHSPARAWRRSSELAVGLVSSCRPIARSRYGGRSPWLRSSEVEPTSPALPRAAPATIPTRPAGTIPLRSGQICLGPRRCDERSLRLFNRRLGARSRRTHPGV